MRLQRVINIGRNARVEILGRLQRIPAQLPTTLASRTSIDSQFHKSELVRPRIQVRLAQLNCLRRYHFPAGIKSPGDRFGNSKLLEFPALKEVESVMAGGWLFSRNDRVEEDAVEIANLTCISNTSIWHQTAQGEKPPYLHQHAHATRRSCPHQHRPLYPT